MAASIPKRAKILLTSDVKPAKCDAILKIVKMRWESMQG